MRVALRRATVIPTGFRSTLAEEPPRQAGLHISIEAERVIRGRRRALTSWNRRPVHLSQQRCVSEAKLFFSSSFFFSSFSLFSLVPSPAPPLLLGWSAAQSPKLRQQTPPKAAGGLETGTAAFARMCSTTGAKRPPRGPRRSANPRRQTNGPRTRSSFASPLEFQQSRSSGPPLGAGSK